MVSTTDDINNTIPHHANAGCCSLFSVVCSACAVFSHVGLAVAISDKSRKAKKRTSPLTFDESQAEVRSAEVCVLAGEHHAESILPPGHGDR